MHIAGNGGPVDRVVGLWRYPVKSLGGEALNEVDVSWHGCADKSSTLVRTPAGTVFDVTDPALAAQLWPPGARVIRQVRPTTHIARTNATPTPLCDAWL
jgi:uncharacterized protein YcbX